MSKQKFASEKLIRNKMLKVMQNQGITVHHRILNDEEYKQQLKHKLCEEAQEVLHTAKKEDLIEELADILEVVNSLLTAWDLTIEQIEAKRQNKAQERGGFDEQIYCSSVEIDKDNPVIKFFLDKPYKKLD